MKIMTTSNAIHAFHKSTHVAQRRLCVATTGPARWDIAHCGNGLTRIFVDIWIVQARKEKKRFVCLIAVPDLPVPDNVVARRRLVVEDVCETTGERP